MNEPAAKTDRPPAAIWLGFMLMCLGMFMAILDIQVVATSLPAIQRAARARIRTREVGHAGRNAAHWEVRPLTWPFGSRSAGDEGRAAIRAALQGLQCAAALLRSASFHSV